MRDEIVARCAGCSALRARRQHACTWGIRRLRAFRLPRRRCADLMRGLRDADEDGKDKA
jgi:hypothetical protein